MPALSTPRSESPPVGQDRLRHIGHARRAVLYDKGQQPAAAPGVDRWIERSWLRCLASGHRPDHAPTFNQIAAPELRHTLEANHLLVQAARPVLGKLGRAIADTRYFAILTNANGVVVDVDGPIDRSNRHADLITRIGTDLSETRLATTAISAALTELQPVWLHRGEHFFEANAVYSCAGAPVFGHDGTCVGMLDLTGIEALERPELKHLVAQSARSIENALTLSRPHALLLRLNWPGHALGDEADGLVGVDDDGFVTAANQTARQMVPQLAHASRTQLHCSDLFAMAFETLFDAARRQRTTYGSYASALEVPLWTGLRLNALPVLAGQSPLPARQPPDTTAALQQPLKDVETALIRQAVLSARGNVMQAARALGISRATVYRRLGAAVRR
jgi:sigma-54 dependent transcriptional regulator, acetoin dehydrogenase operon transcriptional activator AcoR